MVSTFQLTRSTKLRLTHRTEHGFNTDTIQAGKELLPMSYGDGGTTAMALEHGEITEQIIGAAFEVYSIPFGRTRVEFKRFVF